MKPCDISTIVGRLEADELNNIDRQVREVVKGVEETGKAGEVTLKLSFKKNGTNSLLIGTDVKAKVPKKAASARVAYFAFDDTNQATGEISDMPPKQEPLFSEGSNVKPIRSSKN